MKLPADDAANRALLAEHGLSVSNCVPTVPSFLQLGIPGMEGPADPEERPTRSAPRSGASPPTSRTASLCLSGPVGERTEAEARALVLDGLKRAATTAREVGVRLGLEPIHRSQRETAGFVCSLADALGAPRRGGVGDVGIMADTYNLAQETIADVVAAAPRFTGLHVADELPEPEPGVPRAAGRRSRPVGRARRRPP